MPENSSRVVAVTVFTDRARVTRRGQASLEQGTQRLEWTELPSTLDPDSLRVAARGTVAVKLLGVDARKTFFTEAPAAKVRELESRLQTLQDEDAADADRAVNLAKQLAHLDGLADETRIYAYGLAHGKTNLESHAALVAFWEQQRGHIQERARAVAVQRRERARAIEKVQQELAQLRSLKSRERYTVTVELSLSEPGQVEIDVTYLVPSARWRPLYDMRLRGEELEVTYLGEVEQTTDEDWSQIVLTLSTARPAVAAAIPRLQPWYLRPMYARMAPAAALDRARAVGAWKGAHPEGDAMTMAAAAPSAPPVMVQADVETAKVEESGGSVTFQIPGRVDVPSDNSPHKVTVGIFRLRPLFDFVIVPKLAEAVFRRARVNNVSPFTFLPGRTQLFLEDDYLGASDVGLTAPSQRFDLFFGVEDHMRVERGLTKCDMSKSLLGGRRRTHYAYEVRLWNHTKATAAVTVVDQIPLAQHEDIKVSLDMIEPKQSRQDDFNTLIWKLSLPAGGEEKIRYAFTVDHPREMAVAGLG